MLYFVVGNSRVCVIYYLFFVFVDDNSITLVDNNYDLNCPAIVLENYLLKIYLLSPNRNIPRFKFRFDNKFMH